MNSKKRKLDNREDSDPSIIKIDPEAKLLKIDSSQINNLSIASLFLKTFFFGGIASEILIQILLFSGDLIWFLGTLPLVCKHFYFFIEKVVSEFPHILCRHVHVETHRLNYAMAKYLYQKWTNTMKDPFISDGIFFLPTDFPQLLSRQQYHAAILFDHTILMMMKQPINSLERLFNKFLELKIVAPLFFGKKSHALSNQPAKIIFSNRWVSQTLYAWYKTGLYHNVGQNHDQTFEKRERKRSLELRESKTIRPRMKLYSFDEELLILLDLLKFNFHHNYTDFENV